MLKIKKPILWYSYGMDKCPNGLSPGCGCEKNHLSPVKRMMSVIGDRALLTPSTHFLMAP